MTSARLALALQAGSDMKVVSEQLGRYGKFLHSQSLNQCGNGIPPTHSGKHADPKQERVIRARLIPAMACALNRIVGLEIQAFQKAQLPTPSKLPRVREARVFATPLKPSPNGNRL